MSVVVLYLLFCDHPGCTERLAGDTAWETRDRARTQENWQTGKNLNSRDLCPMHVPKEVAGV